MIDSLQQISDNFLNNPISAEQAIKIEKYKIYNLSEKNTIELIKNARRIAKENNELKPQFQELADAWNTTMEIEEKKQLVDKTMQMARDYFNKNDNPAFANDGAFAENMKSKVGGDDTSRGIKKSMGLFVQYLDKLSKQDKETQDNYFQSFPTSSGNEIMCLQGTENNLSNLNAKLLIAITKDDILRASDEAISPLLRGFGNDPHSEKEKNLNEILSIPVPRRKKYIVNFKESFAKQVESQILETKSEFESLPLKFHDVEAIVTHVFPDSYDKAKQEESKSAFDNKFSEFKEKYDVNIVDMIKHSEEKVQWDKSKIEQTLLQKIKPNSTKNIPIKAPTIERAIKSGYEELFNEMVQQENQNSLNNKNKNGYTYLQLAAKSGSVGIVKTLIDKGAELNEKNNQNNTALHLALKGGKTDVAELLLQQKGIDYLALNEKRLRPVDIASIAIEHNAENHSVQKRYRDIQQNLSRRLLAETDESLTNYLSKQKILSNNQINYINKFDKKFYGYENIVPVMVLSTGLVAGIKTVKTSSLVGLVVGSVSLSAYLKKKFNEAKLKEREKGAIKSEMKRLRAKAMFVFNIRNDMNNLPNHAQRVLNGRQIQRMVIEGNELAGHAQRVLNGREAQRRRSI